LHEQRPLTPFDINSLPVVVALSPDLAHIQSGFCAQQIFSQRVVLAHDLYTLQD
jgi:hypothetical protein